MLEIYILGLLTVTSILVLWFFSPLKVTLGEIIFKKILMPDEFDDLVYSKNRILGKLLTCWICMSFWISLIVGSLLSLILQLPLYWGIICFLTYPCICYLYYSLIKRSH